MSLRSGWLILTSLVVALASACSNDPGSNNGGCVLPQLSCGGACVNAAESNLHCGACNNRCDTASQSCVAGRCLPLCPNGQSRCNGACVDTTSNQENCGMCGLRCGPGTLCRSGVCEVSCASGLEACESAKGDAGAPVTVCVDTTRDPLNCGGCGNECGGGQTCTNGQCTCAGGLLACQGQCVDSMNDPNNCGDCGNDCGQGQCQNGVCQCPMGQMSCQGQCVDTQNDPNNCGGCDVQCDNKLEACGGGDCMCKPGLELCNGQCVDTFISPQNCGACGKTCGNQLCGGGMCINQCGGMFPNKCGQTCTNFQNDPLNCGECGKVCNADEICVDGNCENFFIPACNNCPCNECQGDLNKCCFNAFVNHTVCAAECP